MPKITITLFGTVSDPACREARAWLDAQGVVYVYRDIGLDEMALRDLTFMHGHADVPALVAGYRSAVGFDAGYWNEVIAHARALEASGDPLALPPDFGEDPIKL